MYIVRWFFGNPIAATWAALVFGVVATLLFFGSGNEDRDGELKAGASVISSVPVEEQVASVENTEENKVKVSDATSVEVENVIVEEKTEVETPETPETKKENIKTVTGKGDKITTTIVETLDTEKTVDAPLKIEQTKEVKEAEKVKASVTSSPEVSSSATTDLTQVTNEEMLLMAREAYWNNGLDEAAEIYTKLIEAEPMVLEHKGELGNVYWRQGFPKKAAELYSEIAIPMIEAGGTERVANMIGFIGLFYPERAAKIHEKIQSKK